ncbi:MAG: glycine zipper domain-containing protein, partial [Burkholderiaceae bacterium]
MKNQQSNPFLNRIRATLVITALSLGAMGTAQAGDRGAERIAGALFGAVIGAAVGDSIGGSDAAAVGGIIGATVGLAATSNHHTVSTRAVDHRRIDSHYGFNRNRFAVINPGVIHGHPRRNGHGHSHRHSHGHGHSHGHAGYGHYQSHQYGHV